MPVRISTVSASAPDLASISVSPSSVTLQSGATQRFVASGKSRERILQAYPYLEPEDLDAALAYAAWRLEEREEPLVIA